MLLNLYDTTSRGTRLGPVYLLSASPLQHASPQHHTTPLQCLNPLQNSYQEIIQQLFYENSQKCAIPDPGTPYLGHPAQSPSWVASHLSSNFHSRRQRTMSGEAPLALGPDARHLGEVWDSIWPDPTLHFQGCPAIFIFIKCLQKCTIWAVRTLEPSF